MLEKMGDFFDSRIEGYEAHQLGIEGAQLFYPFTASCLPMGQDVCILDLGCGTGLELNYYFQLNPYSKVTGIDLAPGMLARLKERFRDKAITLIQGSYFDIPFAENCYDAAVSVQSLHHFTGDEKMPLYRKLHRALKGDGYLILTDYFAPAESDEIFFRQELNRRKLQEGIADQEFYHYDTPLTVAHETQILREVGFSSVEILGHWGNTYTLKAGNQRSPA